MLHLPRPRNIYRRWYSNVLAIQERLSLSCGLWDVWWKALGATFTLSSKRKRGNGSRNAIRRTGRFWLPHWHLVALFGARTPIFLDVGSQRGPRATCTDFCALLRSSL